MEFQVKEDKVMFHRTQGEKALGPQEGTGTRKCEPKWMESFPPLVLASP